MKKEELTQILQEALEEIGSFSINFLLKTDDTVILARMITTFLKNKYGIKASWSRGLTKTVVILDNYVVKFNSHKEKKYCELESELYNKSKEYQVEKVFLKTEKFLSVGDFDLFIQDRYDEVFEDVRHSEKFRILLMKQKVNTNFVDNETLCNTRLSREFIAILSIYYGKKFVRSLMKFIKDENIDDLHEQNLSFKNKLPCIHDYCGVRYDRQ